MTATPRRIEYRGPEGWTVWGDEDGVHVRTPKGDALEAPDLTGLISLVIEVREQFLTGAIPVPAPPTRDELRQMGGEWRERLDAKRAARAVYRELAPTTTDQPF